MAPGMMTALTERRWKLFIHCSFAWLALLALYFSNERIYADAAYYLIHAVDSGAPWVDHQRFCLALAELPALIALHLGLHLKGIVYVWSISHVFWAWLAAIWCIKLGRTDMAVAIVLLQFIGQTWLFFSPMMEICYGGTFAALLLALWQARPVPSGRHWLAWGAVSLLLVTSHPEHVITLCTVAALVWSGSWRNWRIPLMALAPLTVFLLLKVFFLSSYEASHIPDVGQANIWRWASGAYLLQLADLMTHAYPDLLAIMALGAVMLLREGRKLSVLILVCGALAVVLAVNTAMQATVYSRYHESAYFPFVVCGVLLGTLGLRHAPARWGPWLLLFAISIVGVRSGLIIHQGKEVARHMHAIEQAIAACQAQGKGKCAVPNGYLENPDVSLDWAIPMEALLLARAEQDTAISLVTAQDLAFDSVNAHLPEDMMLFRRWEPRTIASLHPWFQVDPGPYLPLDTVHLFLKGPAPQ